MGEFLSSYTEPKKERGNTMRNKVAIICVGLCLLSSISFAEETQRWVTAAPGIMTSEFKDAKKIIIHPSGIVTEYSIIQLEGRKTQLIKERDRIDAMIANIDTDVQSCSASVIKP